ncbi:Midasin, partial [Stegodyphus mimosarum]
MIEGHWLLLEDIDCAPMDVVSLLVPVLQSRTIVLPGHAHPIKAASGFQLFATQRLLSGFGGSYLEFRNNAEIINKQWRKIMIDPFRKQELEKVIATKWPILEPIIDRILEVYSIFSSDVTNDHGANNEAFNAYSRHGR